VGDDRLLVLRSRRGSTVKGDVNTVELGQRGS